MADDGMSISSWKSLVGASRDPLFLVSGDTVLASNQTDRDLQTVRGEWNGEVVETALFVDGKPAIQVQFLAVERDLDLENAYDQLENLVDARTAQLKRSRDQLHDELVARIQAQDELQRRQVQLVHSSKLAALGQMSAGITHEINNPLAFVSSNLDVLASYVNSFEKLIRAYRVLTLHPSDAQLKVVRELEAEENVDYLLKDVRELVGESREGARRVTEIIRGLKSYSRMDHQELRETDLHEGLESTLKILSQELRGRDCVVEKRYGELPPVRCFPGQMNQVFMNLIVNAAHSTDRQGRVEIETAVLEDSVQIKIRDNGSGISKEKISHIFDPFYTTKEEEDGTGLGLSISDMIVRQHKGEIHVESQEGEGTTFTVTIPINPEPEETTDDG